MREAVGEGSHTKAVSIVQTTTYCFKAHHHRQPSASLWPQLTTAWSIQRRAWSPLCGVLQPWGSDLHRGCCLHRSLHKTIVGGQPLVPATALEANSFKLWQGSKTAWHYSCCQPRQNVALRKDVQYGSNSMGPHSWRRCKVQGTLAITKRSWCNFIVWIPMAFSVEGISFDSKFWEEAKAKLIRFYKMAILPELALSRHTSGQPICEPYTSGDYAITTAWFYNYYWNWDFVDIRLLCLIQLYFKIDSWNFLTCITLHTMDLCEYL